MQNRTLFFGDNLDILREKISDNFFDLIYLDPPFNSQKSYNILFKEGLKENHAQIKAFEDSWHWNREAKETFEELIGVRESKNKINQSVSDLMQAFEKLVGHNDVLAYLTMMTIRLIELKRVLKQTGSLYLHCDPTAGHYLKLALDAIFGKKNFKNEIIWSYKRWTAGSNRFQRLHDNIYFYTKSDEHVFNTQFRPYGEWIKKDYNYKDKKTGKRWRWHTVKGVRYKVFLENKNRGVKIGDVWEIPPIGSTAKERLGYQTQKPEKLLERIIRASSKKGDFILDPFCGCGTTVAVAEKLDRKWVGIDITTLAINLIKYRIKHQFPDKNIRIQTDGLPKDIAGARALFKKDPFEFEYWALDLVGAMPAKSKTKENMKGPDKGVDGILTIIKDVNNGDTKYSAILVQVKGGKVQRRDIATLKGDIEREKAEGGLFITLEEPTRQMREESVDAGNFKTNFSQAEFPKIQILTIKELLQNKKPNIPLGMEKTYYKVAPEYIGPNPKQFTILKNLKQN